jgi:hypothetical protein
MKRTFFLLVAIIAFLLPISLTSCDSGDENEWKPPTEMKTSLINSDPVLKSFLNDGNYPNKTLIASFNYDDMSGFYYGNIGVNDSINEPDTPIYNIILNKKYIGAEDALYFKGRYNFTLSLRSKRVYSTVSDLDGKTVIWKTSYNNQNTTYNNKTLLEFLVEIKNDKYIKDNSYIYRIDIFAQNK